MSNANITNTTTINNAAAVESAPSIAVGPNDVIVVEAQTTNQKVDSKNPEYLYVPVIKEHPRTGDLYKALDAIELPPKKYEWTVKLEKIDIDEQQLVVRTVEEYSSLFKKAEERSAREILQMCRYVYEASETLDSAQFYDFCKRIGYKDTSSAIRKQIVIGKLQPRLINHAEALPATWTGIYLITQIPAQYFINLMNDNRSFKDMPVSEIKKSIRRIELQYKVNKYEPEKVYSEEQKEKIIIQKHPLASICFTKFPDDLDWAAVTKALREVEANLPIETHFVTEMSEVFNLRKIKRYTKMKREQNPLVYKPDTWDLGRDVDAMSKTAGGEIAINDSGKAAA